MTDNLYIFENKHTVTETAPQNYYNIVLPPTGPLVPEIYLRD